MSDSSVLPGGPRADRTRTGKGVGFGRSVAFSAARGAMLVGLAVIIGIVLLQVIDDGTSGPIGDGGSNASAGGTTNTTSSSAGSSSTSSTTAAASPVKPPAQVSVLVLNGSGRPGAATAQTNTLKAKGYQTGTPADAPKRTENIVYFKAGFDRECTTVAASVDGAPKVEAMPSPAPTGSENSSCVVILGS
ncbi:MAG: LytR C-terminal domain-containing protein [Acidimicrobiia bacterium]